jgi:hypothetical protein
LGGKSPVDSQRGLIPKNPLARGSFRAVRIGSTNKNGSSLVCGANLHSYTALGMETLLGGRCKNIGEQLKVLRNKESSFFLMFSV